MNFCTTNRVFFGELVVVCFLHEASVKVFVVFLRKLGVEEGLGLVD